MTEAKRCKRSPVHRYSDGKPFRLSKQRDCSKVGSPISGNESGMSESGFVADARDWKRQIAVVDPYDQTISNEVGSTEYCSDHCWLSKIPIWCKRSPSFLECRC